MLEKLKNYMYEYIAYGKSTMRRKIKLLHGTNKKNPPILNWLQLFSSMTLKLGKSSTNRNKRNDKPH